MSDYSQAIKKFNDQLLAFINKYEIIDDVEPIDSKLLKRILKPVNSLNTTSNQHVDVMNTRIHGFNEIFKAVMEKHKISQDEINEQLIKTIEIINEKYIKKINQLNEEITLLEESNDLKIEDYKSDIEYNIIASNQREEIFEIEYDENKRRFDYQIINAKDTYNQNIEIYNSNHEISRTIAIAQYKEIIEKYKVENEELIIQVKKKIEEKKIELQKLLEQLNIEKNKMKERLRQESIQLNNSIKFLNDNKNKSIVVAKTRYTNSLNESSIEREQRRQEYLAQAQKILKNFVFEMTQLDQRLLELRKENEKRINEDIRPYYYKMLEATKQQELQIKQVLASATLNNPDQAKQSKKLIVQIKKECYKKLNKLKAQKQYYLNMLELILQLDIENNTNQKNILEFDKNYQTIILSEKEQSDNKYYQELNSIHEDDMNLLINIANYKYTRDANLVRCQSRIRSIEINRDFEITEANIQKEIEKIQTDIANLTFELEGANTLREILLTYEENKHNEIIRYQSVSTLLEIEKCKLLNEYNHRQYDLNILNSQTILLFSRKKISIKNEKFEALQNILIDKANTILLRDKVNTSFKIKEEQIFELEEKETEHRNAQYQLNYLNQNVLYERFSMEIKSIQQILSTFIMLLKDLEVFTNKTLSIFFTTVSIRPEYYKVINVFVEDLVKIVNEYYQDIVNALIEHESEIIYKRIEFEEKFKFKIYYNDLLTSYESERKKLLTKNKNIQDTLDNYLKTVEIFKSRIYNLENQNQQIKQKLRNKANKNNYQALNNELITNKQNIEDFKKKIKDITRLKNVLQKDLLAITKELKELDINYNKRVNEIKKMQYNSAISYYTLRNNLIKITSTSLPSFNDMLSIGDKKYVSVAVMLENIKNSFSAHNSNLIKHLYSIVNQFYNSTNISIEKNKQNLLISFKNDVQNIHIRANSNMLANKAEYHKTVLAHINRIKELDEFYISETNRYDQMMRDCQTEFDNETLNIINKQKESLATFYREYYAVCANLDDINRNHDAELFRLLSTFNQDKRNLSNNMMAEMKRLNLNLQTFIANKDELINQLPQLCKTQAQELNKETKEINTELELENKEVKAKSYLQRKNINKTMTQIRNTLTETINQTENELELKIKKEKKSHSATTKHIQRGILKYKKLI